MQYIRALNMSSHRQGPEFSSSTPGSGLLRVAAALLGVWLGAWGGQALAGEVVQKPEFSIELPDGWGEMPPEVMDKANQSLQRNARRKDPEKPKYGFQPKAHRGLKYPYVMVVVRADGRLPESQLNKLQAVDLGRVMKEHKDQLPANVSDIAPGAMVYDRAANIVWLNVAGNVATVGRVQGVSGILPTQTGLVQIAGVAKDASAASDLPLIRRMIMSAKIAPELRYRHEGE